MAKARLFLVVGITKDPMRVWPVSWAVDQADCTRVVEACKAQAKAFVDELTLIWTALGALQEPDRFKHQYFKRNQLQRQNPNYEHESTVYRSQRGKLEAAEHAINTKYRDSMIDALFPTGNDGWCPEVDYVIWPLHEDMRSDLSSGQLMLLRAKLHASPDEDTAYTDEDDNED